MASGLLYAWEEVWVYFSIKFYVIQFQFTCSQIYKHQHVTVPRLATPFGLLHSHARLPSKYMIIISGSWVQVRGPRLRSQAIKNHPPTPLPISVPPNQSREKVVHVLWRPKSSWWCESLDQGRKRVNSIIH